MKNTLQDYKSSLKPVWCPGCGDYGVLNGLQKALLNLEIQPERIVTVSGIGCSGRFSHYMNTYSLHGTHGRALPTAVGVKAVRPDLDVIVVGGDGDGLGIGGGHIPHVARKNVDLTYLLIDNRVYGLTKGQASPTTPVGLRTKTSPYGVYDHPMDPIPMFITYDVSFVARTSVVELKELQDVIEKAIVHKGLSIVYVLSPCQTFPILDRKELTPFLKPLPEDHPRNDRIKAIERAYSADPIYTGIFYQVERQILSDHLESQIDRSISQKEGKKVLSVKDLLERFA